MVVLIGLYLGSPYLAVRSFKDAARSADVHKLEAAVDFPAVRENLKSQMSIALMPEMINDPQMKLLDQALQGSNVGDTFQRSWMDSPHSGQLPGQCNGAVQG